VIHLNGYVHAAADWRAPVLVVGHSCVLSWWEAVKNESLPDSWLDYAARVSHGLQAAAHVVAPSQAMLNCLRRHYRQLPPATVIHNGRRRDLFHTEAKKELILSAGRLWDEAKNLQALDAVADRLPWPIVVAGDTEPHAKPANVRCIGRLNEQALAQCMSEAAIYALPAKYEPFGLSALEAALSGCALVLGDIPSQRELWEDAALFADPNDHEQLAATLRRCIEQPALRRQMAHRAGVRASLYTTRAMAEKYLKVYGQLLSEPAGVSEQSLQTLKG
jgi:glycosyltransferase involved in cell wall biosynthesis